MMHTTTFIGLDVHARKIVAAALDTMTGEVHSATFGYDAAAVADWIRSVDPSAKCVYESGVTGFDLQKRLTGLGVDCAIGRRKGNRAAAHWAWIRSIEFSEKSDNDVLAYYIDAVRQATEDKKRLERLVEAEASKPRWKKRVDSLRRLKGVDIMTAADIVFEAGEFARFGNARAFAAWPGLVPSEHSSGEKIVQGGITKAGNRHLRRVMAEAAWHYNHCSAHSKDLFAGQAPDPAAMRHAAKGVRRLVERRRGLLGRGMQKNKADVATARELACWCWAVGCMAE